MKITEIKIAIFSFLISFLLSLFTSNAILFFMQN